MKNKKHKKKSKKAKHQKKENPIDPDELKQIYKDQAAASSLEDKVKKVVSQKKAENEKDVAEHRAKVELENEKIEKSERAKYDKYQKDAQDDLKREQDAAKAKEAKKKKLPVDTSAENWTANMPEHHLQAAQSAQ